MCSFERVWLSPESHADFSSLNNDQLMQISPYAVLCNFRKCPLTAVVVAEMCRITTLQTAVQICLSSIALCVQFFGKNLVSELCQYFVRY